MGDAYPELVRAQPLITETLKLEETRFKTTLGTGLKLLDDETKGLSAGGTLKGEVAFKLYDTFGFPLDLTQDVLRARDITVDTAGFEKAMDEQRAKARAAWAGSGEAASEAIWFDVRQRVGATEFLGYDTERAEGKVTAIIVDGKEATALKAGQTGWLVVNQTPFYAESGGQQGDTGRFVGARRRGRDRRRAQDGRRPACPSREGREGHDQGRRRRGDDRRCDPPRPAARASFGDPSAARGAAPPSRHARHPEGLAGRARPAALRHQPHQADLAEELRKIEDEVNARIRLNSPVETRLMTPEEAIAAGAMALFGEKYGEEVRVLSMGGADGEKYSVELCGGTHALRTGDIGLFRILGEGAVSSGVRRIEAVAGNAAEAHVRHQVELLNDAASVMKVRPEDLPVRLQALVDGQRKIERELTEARKALALAGSGGGAAERGRRDAREVGGVTMIGRVLNGVPGQGALRGMADAYKKKLGSGVVALIGGGGRQGLGRGRRDRRSCSPVKGAKS